MADKAASLPLRTTMLRDLLAVLLVAAVCTAETLTCSGGDCSNAAVHSQLLEIRENGKHEPGQQVQVSCGSPADLLVPLALADTEQDYRLFDPTGRPLRTCEDLQQTHTPIAHKVRPMGPGPHGPGHFMFPTVKLGHRINLSHVTSPREDANISLITISHSPRMFIMENFFTEEEADALIAHALSITDPERSLKRSSTGATGYYVDKSRTSDNAWDAESDAAKAIRRRIIDVLSLGVFHEEWLDGLQTLRYKPSAAYTLHHDYLSGTNNHNFNSWNGGTNRYATVLLYLSDVDAGGETLFPHGQAIRLTTDAKGNVLNVSAYNPEKTAAEALAEIVEKEPEAMQTGPLALNSSWERPMVGKCAVSLAVPPRKARAVLFYSQTPAGHHDKKAEHGACPVLRGTKWLANLWVWNGCRLGYDCAPGFAKEEKVVDETKQVPASFHNIDIPGAQLMWEDKPMMTVEVGASQPMNTYVGHRFFLRDASGKVIHGPMTVPPGTSDAKPYVVHLSKATLRCGDRKMC